MIELRTLGTLELTSADGRAAGSVLAQPRRAALLCYLALAIPRGFHRRDTLFALFWPEDDAEQARHALRQSVYFLRRALGAETIVSRGDEELSLGPEQVRCDVWTFEAAIAQERPADALALYRGELLAGFHISAAPEFERWLDQERARVRQLAVGAGWVLAATRERDGDAAGAAEAARRAAALAPTDETGLRRLILLLQRLGDRAAAVRAYEAFAWKLEEEYELEPSAETQAVVARIRAEPGESQAVEPGHQRRFSLAAGDHNSKARMLVAMSSTGPRLDTANLLHGLDSGTSDRTFAAGATRRSVGSHGRLLMAGLGSIAVAALALAMLVVSWPTGPPPKIDPDLLAIAPFDARAPQLEPWSEGVVDVLSRSLDGAGAFRTVPPSVSLKGWTGRADRASAQALGRRTGAGLVVFGSLDRSGADSVRIRAAVLEVGARKAPVEVEVRGDTLRMDRVVDSLTVAVLRELGRTRPVGAVRQSSISATSLPALKAFLQGEHFYRRGLWDSALVQYDRTLALDSSFALAYRRMSLVAGWNSAEAVRYRPSDEYARRAAAFNHGLAPRDSLLIFTDSLMMLGLDPGSGAYFENKRRLFSTLTEAQRQYPGDPEVWYAVGEGRFHLGGPAVATQVEMLEAFDRAIAVDSGFTPAYLHGPGLAVAIDYGDPQRARRYLAAYLRLNPRDDNSAPLRLTATLLDSSQRDLPGTARLIDTTPARVLWSVGVEYLSQWPDSAETAVRVLRSLVFGRHGSTAPPSKPWNDSSVLRRALASALTFRGHLREAYRTHSVFAARYPDRFLNPYVRLALLGAVPAETAAAAFRLSLEQDQAGAVGGQVLILPWFFARRDTAALGRFAARYDSLTRRDSVPLTKALRQYGANAARAYARLAVGDSTVALRAFASLPDSVCVEALDGCRHEKLVLSRLLRVAGEDRKAFEVMVRWTGLDPEVVLQRAGLAERLGERETAIKSYRFVTDAWRYADPELQPLVQQARGGLDRVMAGSGAGSPRRH